MQRFEIVIQRQSEDGWPVVVQYDVGAAAMRGDGLLVLDSDALYSADDPLVYGNLLGQAIFYGQVREAFVRALAVNSELRVLLYIEDQQLTGLRWERLCAPLDGDWAPLALNRRTPFSRHLPGLSDRHLHLIGRRDLRTLVVAASPAALPLYGLAPFDAATMAEEVRRALGSIPATLLTTSPGSAGPATLDAICAQLTASPFTILHLVCHGRILAETGETVLYLGHPDDPAETDAVLGSRLIKRLAGLGTLPRLVFLASCDTASPEVELALGGLGQRLVRELGIPAVVAMTEPVSIATAGALASRFYERLREHGEPDCALVEASAALAERGDVLVPALFGRFAGQPLFSEDFERPLSPGELSGGLDDLERLLPERAPAAAAEFAAAAASLRATLSIPDSQLSPAARRERDEARARVDALALEVADLSFAALAQGRTPPAYDARCPFPGLAAFQSAERRYFFGRDELIAQMERRLGEHSFLAVLGPSGSGKSSLVLAGLVPWLQAGRPGLRIAYLTPDALPLAKLDFTLYQLEQVTSAAAGTESRILVVVDQFEELFTLCHDEEERRAFLDALFALVGSHLVVITMRADFWGECAPYRALRAQMTAHQELIAPLNASELRQAAERQAAAVALRFEPGLTDLILQEVTSEPGAMPLLQHALAELWRRRRGRWLRIADYRAIGGVAQAIAHTADAIYDAALHDDKRRLRDIFVRLTRIDQERTVQGERRDTRQRVRIAELVPAGEDPVPLRELVRRLAGARLVVTGINPSSGDEEVEVAHEALIRSWPRLRTWLDEDRVGLQVRAAVRQAARDWELHDSDEGLLVHRGGRLEEAERITRQSQFTLNSVERAYLDACIALHERIRAEEEAERERDLAQARALAAEQQHRAELEQRRAEEQAAAGQLLRRRARFILGIAIVAIMALVAAIFFANQAADQEYEAELQRDAAEEAREEALTAEAQADAERDVAEEARQAAVTAEAIAERNAAEARERAMLADARAALTTNDPAEALALALAGIKDGTLSREAYSIVAEASDTGARAVFEIRDGAKAGSVQFMPDQRTLVVTEDAQDSDREARILFLTIESRKLTQRLIITDALRSSNVVVIPGSAAVLAGLSDGRLRLWSSLDGSEILTLGTPEEQARVNHISISANGQYALSGHTDGTLLYWNLTERRVERSLIGSPLPIYATAFSPDGTSVAAGNEGGDLYIWRVTQSEPLRHIIPDEKAAGLSLINTIAFRPVGDPLIVYGQGDGSISFASLDGQITGSFRNHERPVTTLSFSPDGSQLLSGSGDRQIKLWRITEDNHLDLNWAYIGQDREVEAVALSPDGSFVAACAGDRVWLWDALGSNRIAETSSAAPVRALNFSADGLVRWFLSERELTLSSWDLTGTANSRAFAGPATPIVQSYQSPDGTHAVLLTQDGELLIYDLVAQELIQRLDSSLPKDANGHVRGQEQLALSPDNRLLALVQPDRSITLIDLASGSIVRTVKNEDYAYAAPLFSPDGSLLAAQTGVEIHIWSVADGIERMRLGESDGHDDYVTTFVFSNDTKLLASAGTDQAIIIWDLATGNWLRKMTGHSQLVAVLAFHPDGTLLASGSQDDTIRIWEVDTGIGIGLFNGHRADIRALAFSPDGKYLASAGLNRTIIAWQVRTRDELVAWVNEDLYVEELTCGQREDYQIEPLCES